MIKSIDHAIDVQQRRQDARKHSAARIGLAKSIRRYLLRNHSSDYKRMRGEIIQIAWDRINASIGG